MTRAPCVRAARVSDMRRRVSAEALGIGTDPKPVITFFEIHMHMEENRDVAFKSYSHSPALLQLL